MVCFDSFLLCTDYSIDFVTGMLALCHCILEVYNLVFILQELIVKRMDL